MVDIGRLRQIADMAIRSKCGSVVTFTKNAKILERKQVGFDGEVYKVKKGRRVYVVAVAWYRDVDDAGFCSLVWRAEDVKGIRRTTLVEAVRYDTYRSVREALKRAPVAHLVERGTKNGKAYLISRMVRKDPTTGQVVEKWYRLAFWHRADDPYTYDYKIGRRKFKTLGELRKTLERLLNE